MNEDNKYEDMLDNPCPNCGNYGHIACGFLEKNPLITELEEKLKELEYQLEQQQSMNPISVNMIATISELSEKLKVANNDLDFVCQIAIQLLERSTSLSGREHENTMATKVRY